jgi:predicted ribosomally synthesized peptide with nif11-like leader
MSDTTRNQNLQPSAMPVQVLMEKYCADSGFRSEFDEASNSEEAVRVAARHGIPVSIGDITALGEASNELSDNILARVSGGGGSGESYSEFNYTFS